MRIFSLDRVFSLAQALLFSLLYGAEFLGRLDVVRRCEATWWSGIRKFYGLPNGVSQVTLCLLFPRFSLVHRVLLAKTALALRGLRRLDTLFPEALFYDRGLLFERHRVGFLQVIKDWGLQLGLPDLFRAGSRAEAAATLDETREKGLDGAWDSFARMPSTKFAASLLGNCRNFYEVSLQASRLSRLGLRVFLLSITGSLAQSYIKKRACPTCGDNFSFEHLLSCSTLGVDLREQLRLACEVQDWKAFVSIVVGRFQVFVYLHRGGLIEPDESDLFEALNE
jgi:hypothetical protein